MANLDVVMTEKPPVYSTICDFPKSVEYKLYPPGSTANPIDAKRLWGDIIKTALTTGDSPYASVSHSRRPDVMSILVRFGPESSGKFHERLKDVSDYRNTHKKKYVNTEKETADLYDQYQSSGVSEEDDTHPSVMVFEGPMAEGLKGPREKWELMEGWNRKATENILNFAVRNSGLIISYERFVDDFYAGVGRSVDMFNTFLELGHSKWAIYASEKVYKNSSKEEDLHGPLLCVAPRPVNGQPPPRNSGIPLAFFKETYRFEEHRFTYFYIPFDSPVFEPWDLRTAASKAVVTKVSRQPTKIRGLARDVQEFASRFSSHERPIRIGTQLSSGMDRKELFSALVHSSPEPGSAEACSQRSALIEHLIGVQLLEPITPGNIGEVEDEYKIGHNMHGKKPSEIKVVDFDHPISNPMYSYRPRPYVVGPGARYYGRRAYLGRPWYRRPYFIPPLFPPIIPPVYVAPPPPVYVAPPPPPPVVYLPDSPLYGLPPEAVLYDPVVGLPFGWMLLSNGYRVPLGADIGRMRGVSVLRRSEQPRPIKEEMIAQQQNQSQNRGSIDEYPPYKQKLSEQARLVADMKAIRAQFNKLHTK